MDLEKIDISSLVKEIHHRILEAKEAIKDIVHETPLDYSKTFSRISENNVYLKLENLQKTGSFKVRGAFYKISKLPREARIKGIIAASAGNHAQGVAYAASRANVRAKIVMPLFTPIAKVLATKSYGAEVILHGSTFDEAYDYALNLAEKENLTFIPPFDDVDIIAGQGTIGLEIIKELKDLDAVVVPIGGGGLISGIAIAIKKELGNRVKIIGVETEAYRGAYELLKGPLYREKPSHTIAEGIAVKRIGKITSRIIKHYVDDVIIVSDDLIVRAIFLLLERAKILAEGAGAAPIAALMSEDFHLKNKNVVAVISGGNINMSTLMKVISRELASLKRVVKLRVRLPDRPGALMEFLKILSECNINTIDINSERYDPKIPPYESEVVVVVEVGDPSNLDTLYNRIKRSGFDFQIE